MVAELVLFALLPRRDCISGIAEVPLPIGRSRRESLGGNEFAHRVDAEPVEGTVLVCARKNMKSPYEVDFAPAAFFREVLPTTSAVGTTFSWCNDGARDWLGSRSRVP
jgi:hypothetical protein